jgi:hypothetical protein
MRLKNDNGKGKKSREIAERTLEQIGMGDQLQKSPISYQVGSNRGLQYQGH